MGIMGKEDELASLITMSSRGYFALSICLELEGRFLFVFCETDVGNVYYSSFHAPNTREHSQPFIATALADKTKGLASRERKRGDEDDMRRFAAGGTVHCLTQSGEVHEDGRAGIHDANAIVKGYSAKKNGK